MATMEFGTMLGDIVILLGAASLLGMLCERIGFSAIIGALLAGVLVGPGVLHAVATEPKEMEQIAEIGVALLLFTIGLELSRSRLRTYGLQGVRGGVLQIVVTIACTAGVVLLLGGGTSMALVVGSMIAISSTASVARVLTEQAELDSQHGRVSMSVLIMQDLAIVPLLLMVSFLGQSTSFNDVAVELGGRAFWLACFLAGIFLVGLLVIPRIFGSTARTGNRDLPIVLALVTCLLAAWIAWLLGFSPALGAFVAGLVLADSPYAQQIRADVLPFKAVFLTLFFASIGMLADVPWLLSGVNLWIVLGVAAAIILGKIVLAGLVFRLLGIQGRISIASALCLAQIGEFSFVIGTAAPRRDLISNEIFQILTSASLVTLLLVPLLVGRSHWCSTRLVRLLVGLRLMKEPGPEGESLAALEDHVILVGAGPAGRSVLDRLRGEGREPVIIEMNPRTVRELGREEHRVVLGNAARGGILLHAGVKRAQALIVTLPDTTASVGVIEQARNLAPDLLIAARARYKVHNHLLEEAGADVVITEEDQVGDVLGEVMIDRLRGNAPTE